MISPRMKLHKHGITPVDMRAHSAVMRSVSWSHPEHLPTLPHHSPSLSLLLSLPLPECPAAGITRPSAFLVGTGPAGDDVPLSCADRPQQQTAATLRKSRVYMRPVGAWGLEQRGDLRTTRL